MENNSSRWRLKCVVNLSMNVAGTPQQNVDDLLAEQCGTVLLLKIEFEFFRSKCNRSIAVGIIACLLHMSDAGVHEVHNHINVMRRRHDAVGTQSGDRLLRTLASMWMSLLRREGPIQFIWDRMLLRVGNFVHRNLLHARKLIRYRRNDPAIFFARMQFFLCHNTRGRHWTEQICWQFETVKCWMWFDNALARGAFYLYTIHFMPRQWQQCFSKSMKMS